MLNGLNDQQREAVKTTEGPVLILAGAGSGKTKALTHRIAYLVKEKGVSPHNILAVTFTNKAAGVMAERVASLLSPTSNPLTPNPKTLPWLGTFHSICVKILRREIGALGYPSHFTIYDETDILGAVKKAMFELKVDTKQYNPNAIRSMISGAKCEMVGPKDYAKYAQGHFQEIASRVYGRYDDILRKASALDFDDLLNKAVELFSNFPDVLAKYQDQFHYVLVDEYQDTNHTQYLLCKLLSQKRENIFVIGDDWQSIYSWRGARFRNILDFEKDYPNAKIIKLEENYRSTQNILDVAQSVITKNQERSDKKLWTRAGSGDLVTVFEAQEGQAEIDFIIQELHGLYRSKKIKLKDAVVLYRTNAQSRAIEEKLIEYRIPYRIIGGVRFYERKEIKDVLSYIKFANNPDDVVSLERIINIPPRKIGPKAWSDIVELGLKEASQENANIAKFTSIIEQLHSGKDTLSVPDFIDMVLRKSGLYDFLNDGTDENLSRLENIKELKTVAQRYNSIAEFLEGVALVSDIDSYNESADVLTLMTVHSAKGLEFPVVFLVGLEEGLFPHSRSLTDTSELEEERRLCYVGMTRAMTRLYLTCAKSRMIYGSLQYNQRSRFLDEIPVELLDEIK